MGPGHGKYPGAFPQFSAFFDPCPWNRINLIIIVHSDVSYPGPSPKKVDSYYVNTFLRLTSFDPDFHSVLPSSFLIKFL